MPSSKQLVRLPPLMWLALGMVLIVASGLVHLWLEFEGSARAFEGGLAVSALLILGAILVLAMKKKGIEAEVR